MRVVVLLCVHLITAPSLSLFILYFFSFISPFTLFPFGCSSWYNVPMEQIEPMEGWDGRFTKNAPADVLVVGAGHAGCEAAFASARMGCDTLLITSQKDTLGLMPCNPAVGGLAKSHLVVELDVLGGEMGLNADLTGLQYRTLNASRGPAVRAVRIQCDKAAYSARMAKVAASLPKLTLVEGTVVDLILAPSKATLGRETPPHPSTLEEGCPIGVCLADGCRLYARFIVVTAGTALGGKIWVGHSGREGGGDARLAVPLPETLRKIAPNLGWRRLKTGTPPRIWNASVDWKSMTPQNGETNPIPFFSRRMRLFQERWRDENYGDVPRGTLTQEETNENNHPFFPTLSKNNSVPRGTSDDAKQPSIESETFGNPVTFGPEGLPTDAPEWSMVEGFATYRLASEKPCGNKGVKEQTPAVRHRQKSVLENEMAETFLRARCGQLPCFQTHTTPESHAIIRKSLHESALYGGEIVGEGVRYCPSIEDKVVRFGDRGGHHVILEPEGKNCPWCYPNGLSNSLPEETQLRLARSVPGLSRAEFAAPGYAIEYDCIDPRALDARLSVKGVPNLFMAGQINGTTGYEEAAAQGFYAGVNAALTAQGREPFLLSRDEAYIGVMVDDLITKGTDEPYRMFTSRAERRLLLRPGNAHLRLHAHAKRIGIVSKELLRLTEEEATWLERTEAAWRVDWLNGRGLSRWKLLARDGVDYASACTAQKEGSTVLSLPDASQRKNAQDDEKPEETRMGGTPLEAQPPPSIVADDLFSEKKTLLCEGELPFGRVGDDPKVGLPRSEHEVPLPEGRGVEGFETGLPRSEKAERSYKTKDTFLEVLPLPSSAVAAPSLETHSLPLDEHEASLRWGRGVEGNVPMDWAEELELRAKYEGYIAHEAAQAARLAREGAAVIPSDFCYANVKGLRFEAREKLERIRPDTLRRASGIPGVNPADVALLALALRRRKGARE